MRTRWFLAVLASSLLTGCIERRFVIDSVDAAGNPLAAKVFINGAPVGNTLADAPFVYHGKYEFLLVKDGYETLSVVQQVRTPWWEIPPLDLFVEAILPFQFREVRRYRYTMQLRKDVRAADLLQRGGELRIQGQQIAEPGRVLPPAPTPVPALPPPTTSPAPAAPMPRAQ
jgi:hypothetical protein